ncbi:MAG: MotA/TolQ/ExbB proton channel family protein [Alphaproteobacteria bacterium]|nr:MotA/TolQ/ExbB proton channel family protein [Alphaproteobacteria bacterium]MCB9697180.1 MotA/TolQ/ExbB proton channel family protein [Alphaproteobacteria bacterium]
MLLLLLESLARAEEAAPGFSFGEMWAHAGFIARGVIITLVIMMLFTLLVVVERLIAFSRARRQSMRLRNEIIGALQQGDIAAAHRISQDDQFKSGYLAGLLRAGLREMDEGGLDKFALDNSKRAVNKAHAEELAKLQRGMPVLATVASTAPFVGLFGTTFGVINAFQGMASAGSGLAAISAGISEALITTGVGIGVAVLGVWAFNYFNHRIAKVTDELNSAEADFVAWAAKLIQGSMRGAAK